MKAFVHILQGVLLLLKIFDLTNDYSSLDPTPSPISADYGIETLNRSSFPPHFTFGLVSAAYQVEGAWNVDGKGPSNWDNFTHSYPERIADHSNGDNATKSYYFYKDDVQLLKDMNADAYWLSISWSRVLPNGKVNKGRGINYKGIEYYNNLIDDIIAKGLKPCVTIFDFELPQALEDEYGSLLNRNKFIKDFHDFADLLFRIFGDRVKQWSTINEPLTVATLGYDRGIYPPNRCSTWMNNSCFVGDSSIEPYEVGHTLLLAHADVVHLYRTKYKVKQKGIIGIQCIGFWPLPYNASNRADHNATRRYIDFNFGWFLSPITFGYYPQSMRNYLGKRLPEFTKKQSLLLHGSIDFLGLNYYSGYYVANIDLSPGQLYPQSPQHDVRVIIHFNNSEGVPIGEELGVSWQHSYPEGIWHYLRHIKQYYNNPIIYVTENGASELNNPNISLEQALRDKFRVKFHFQHLAFVKKAIDDGVKVKGYFGFSLADHFEYLEGYTIRYGFIYIDYTTFKRYLKLSAYWLKRFLAK